MSKLRFDFNYKKSTQALNYFSAKQDGKVNKMKALKLIFLADRYHLRKYGRLITNDFYVAMRHGPVPSTTKDIAEFNDYLDDIPKDYSAQYIKLSGFDVVSKRKADIDVFSESDLEALNFAWEHFGHYNQFQLRDITHSYPEWNKYRRAVESGSCFEMNILDLLQEPNEEVDEKLELDEEAHKTFELDDEDRVLRREDIEERVFIEALWR